MSWALTVEGRTDPAGIVLLIDEREEAESIAQDIRRNGIPIVIRPYAAREKSAGVGLSPGARVT